VTSQCSNEPREPTGDDHYIPDLRNAHLDLSSFHSDAEVLVKEYRALGFKDAELVEGLYSQVLKRVDKKIYEPDEDDLICRYLTPGKFLWFCADKSLHFSSPSKFDDPKECSVHEDYEWEIERILIDKEINPATWDVYSAAKAQEWLISCWTKLDDHDDDILLWHKYADGPTGVGITVRYGHLKAYLKELVPVQAVDDLILSGSVEYGPRICLPPFNKRRIFRNEKEVRFAFRHLQFRSSEQFNVGDAFSIFRLRLAPDAPPHHEKAICELWSKCGGTN